VIAARERQPTNSNSILGMACRREQGASPDSVTPPEIRPAVTRRRLRLAALALAAGIAGIASVPAAASTAGPASPGAAAQPAGARQRPWIAITSVTPGFAQPTGKVTVSGIVTNPGGAPLRGLSVQLWSWQTPLTSSEMASYLTAPEPTGVDAAIIGAQRTLSSPVPPHGTEQWTMTLTAKQVGMQTFGVYPLAAHLFSASAVPGIAGPPLDDARTFLPYWPGKSAAKTVPPASIAWVWPLIDTPQQTVCQTLTSNELAGNVASKGRLGSLLAAGETATGRRALLTWAIDPALLSDLSVMSKPYRVTGTGSCYAGKPRPASSAAQKWLAGLQAVAAHQDFFTTPYADVDVAALDHAGMEDPELAAAFADGSMTAARTDVPGTQTKVLGSAQRVTPPTVGRIAWPAGGIADYGLVEALAHDGIQTGILNSGLIHTPATVTTVSNGQGGVLTVLRASNTLTQILSTRRDLIPGLVPSAYSMTSGARPQARLAAAFAKEQWFLAETAMIAAQAPAAGRSIVVAPPRNWNPLPGMAGALLDDTVNTPWLQPVTVASLASAGAQTDQAGPKPPPERVTRAELSRSLLGKVAHLDEKIQLLDGILTTPGHGYLSTAVDTVESSAWRGRKANERPAKQLLRSDLAYVQGRLQQVQIVGSLRITLGGQNGVVPVSISNGLGQPVTVKLLASAPPADHVTIGKFTNVITVQGHTQRTIKIPITVPQAGSTTLTLRLATKENKLLPVRPVSLNVVATHFGTLAIVIISIALVVFVLTATARAIRRDKPQDNGSAAEAEELDAMPSTRDPASAGDEPDTVITRGVDDRQPAKEADEHASTPGAADRS
jgi:hypothetical protein